MWASILSLSGAADSADATYPELTQCLASINGIKSYDVTFRLSMLSFDNNVTNIAVSWTSRDVLAIRLGRRIENCLDIPASRDIAIIDWRTAKNSGKPLAQAISLSLPGFGYYDYLNPTAGRMFLGDLLVNRFSKIKRLESTSSEGNGVGFEVLNNRVGAVRLWLDPDHGFLPSTLEFYGGPKGRDILLDRRIHVEKFLRTPGGNWVPSVAVNSRYAPADGAAPLAYSGQKIELDEPKCFWNSIKNDELFQSKNLAGMNFSRDGWHHAASPTVLRAHEENTRLKSLVAGGSGRAVRRTILIVLVLLAIPIVIVILNRVSRNHPSPI
jgi:hypothetical protein